MTTESQSSRLQVVERALRAACASNAALATQVAQQRSEIEALRVELAARS